MADLGLNTVRIPVSKVFSSAFLILILCEQLGYWIVEPLVDRSTEFYPRGGIEQLVRVRVHACVQQATEC
jgi:hypothetical protein